MRGVGSASGAISVLNALPTGLGAALGIALSARAEVTVREGPPGPSVVHPDEARTPLVEASLATGLAWFHPEPARTAELTVVSEIPPSVGLKSSSAVASAILLAVARSAGASVSAIDIARQAAEVGQRVGVSATGAFDDALAGLVRGVVVTDNRDRTLLRQVSVPPGLEAALWIPGPVHPPAPSLRDRFVGATSAAGPAVDAALAGDWAAAMELNSSVVEAALGYPYAPIRRALKAAGALASGASGLGPTLAAVTEPNRRADVLAALPATPGVRRVVPLTSDGVDDPEAPR